MLSCPLTSWNLTGLLVFLTLSFLTSATCLPSSLFTHSMSFHLFLFRSSGTCISLQVLQGAQCWAVKVATSAWTAPSLMAERRAAEGQFHAHLTTEHALLKAKNKDIKYKEPKKKKNFAIYKVLGKTCTGLLVRTYLFTGFILFDFLFCSVTSCVFFPQNNFMNLCKTRKLGDQKCRKVNNEKTSIHCPVITISIFICLVCSSHHKI